MSFSWRSSPLVFAPQAVAKTKRPSESGPWTSTLSPTRRSRSPSLRGIGITRRVGKGLLDEWGEQTGAAYRLVEFKDKVTAAKKDLPTADLIILPFAEMGEFVVADRLSLMPPALTSGDSATSVAGLLFGPAQAEGYHDRRRYPAIIPFSCPVLTCYYRKDLLEKAGKKPPRPSVTNTRHLSNR